MTSHTRVTIKDTDFPSINRARLHYTAILHKYSPGQRLSPEDHSEITALTSAAPFRCDSIPPEHVTVTVGSFGRPCFELAMPDRSPQKISMMKSIKQHVERRDRIA